MSAAASDKASKNLDAFGYSRWSNLDAESDDETVVAKEPKEEEEKKTAPPFQARLTWQNTKSEALVQMMLPFGMTPNGVRVNFEVRQTMVEYGFSTGVQTVKLPHPAVVPARCKWTLSSRHFRGFDEDQPCADLHLVKAIEELWNTDTFDLGGQRAPQKDAQEPEGPREPPPRRNPNHQPGDAEAFTFEQEDDKISIWFSVNDELTSSDVIVHAKTDVLHVDFFRTKTDRLPYASIVKHLRAPVKPDETIWMFDQEADRGRCIRIDLVMRDDADWSDTGPFKETPEEDLKKKKPSTASEDNRTT